MKMHNQTNKIKMLILFVVVGLLSGCVGSGLRNIMTEEKEYKELIKEIPDIQQGYGRIFIYSPKGGPEYPLNSMGDIDFFSIDQNIYRFGGESYFYLDIKMGPRLITSTNVVVRGFASNKKQYGKNRLQINVDNKKSIYLRFVNHGSKSITGRDYDVSVIDKNKAELEIENLSFWNNHETTMIIE